MKKTAFLYFLPIVLTIACSDKKSINLDDLNGYWEINKVRLPDGSSKEYNVNSNIDFFKIEIDSTGYRKKLQPKLDGSFHTSNDAEPFKLKIINQKPVLYYKNSLAEWSENIIKLNKDVLVIENQSNLKYFYKRFEAINITIDEQKEQ